MTTGEAIQRDIGDAITKAVAEHEGGLVTKWVALVETVGPDGERGLWPCTGGGVTKWDAVGMLQYAVFREQAAMMRPED